MEVDDQPETTSSSELPSQPPGWSKEDKYNLLQALKCSQSSASEDIMTLLPSKSAEEIEDMIEYYRRRSAEHPLLTKRGPIARRALKKISRAPIALWAKLLTDSFSFKELETETATALHLIADFEDIPPGGCTGGVDFRTVYHTLANAMEGKEIPDDKIINAVLEKCVVEAAYTGKVFIRNSSLRNIVDKINLTETANNVVNRFTDNHELTTLRYLASQRRYNPLNIEEKYLKPTFQADKD